MISVTVNFMAEESGRPQKPQPSISLSGRHHENLLFPKIIFTYLRLVCVFFKWYNNCTVYHKLIDHAKYPFCCGVPQNWKERKI
jgi:hypothetical protein